MPSYPHRSSQGPGSRGLLGCPGAATGSPAERQDFIAGPDNVTTLPSGHDAWVVGDEPVVAVDWLGAALRSWSRCPPVSALDVRQLLRDLAVADADADADDIDAADVAWIAPPCPPSGGPTGQSRGHRQ